jgi:hypothetical protein
MYLMDLIGGQPETDLEKAIDRFFLGQSISNVTSKLFDPNRRKRELEEKLLQRYLLDDSIYDRNKTAADVVLALGRQLTKTYR